MPAISFFADQRDASLLVDRLNADSEIAFLIPDGPQDPQEAFVQRLRAAAGNRAQATTFYLIGGLEDGYRQRWKAVRTVDHLEDGDHSLWHIPSGPLPLLTLNDPNRPITDPWAGWTEECSGAEPATPYFAGASAEIRLSLWSRHRPYSAEEKARLALVYSDRDRKDDILMGSSFQGSGGPSPQRRWWGRLKTWFDRSAAKLSDGRATGWALPSALGKLKAGLPYDSLGWNVSAAIQAAQLRPRSPEARDLVSSRAVVMEPAWLQWKGGTVSLIARRIYEERAFQDLPILADAKEEAHQGQPRKCLKMRENMGNSALLAWRQSGRNPVESRGINSTLLHWDPFPLLPSSPSGFVK